MMVLVAVGAGWVDAEAHRRVATGEVQDDGDGLPRPGCLVGGVVGLADPSQVVKRLVDS